MGAGTSRRLCSIQNGCHCWMGKTKLSPRYVVAMMDNPRSILSKCFAHAHQSHCFLFIILFHFLSLFHCRKIMTPSIVSQIYRSTQYVDNQKLNNPNSKILYMTWHFILQRETKCFGIWFEKTSHETWRHAPNTTREVLLLIYWRS